jgi:spore coat polysaccharide biosynthesis protein SpsF
MNGGDSANHPAPASFLAHRFRGSLNHHVETSIQQASNRRVRHSLTRRRGRCYALSSFPTFPCDFAEVCVDVCAFVQARMSSRRFPGKVLAPFRGQPVIAHVVAAVRSSLPATPVVVVTSTDATDDPLAAYLGTMDVPVFRGGLHDVFGRFRAALAAHPATWILRVCADSPLLSSKVLRLAVSAACGTSWDLVTTTSRRTFPKGQNAEVIRADALRGIDASEIDDGDREHVTQFFHRNPHRFRILNVESGNPKLAELNHCVDTVEDLQRLEQLADGELGLEAVL